MSTSTPARSAPRKKISFNVRQYGILVALVIIILLFQVLTAGRLLMPGNVNNLIQQNAYVLILAIGMVMVIIAGHIDLSVGSVVAMVGAVSAIGMQQWGLPWWAAVLIALVVGAVVGAWQGFWIAYVGIPAFIVTLAGMLLFRGLTYLVLDNVSLSPFPHGYREVASGFLDGIFGSITISEGEGLKAVPVTADIFTLVIGVLAVIGLVVSSLRTRRTRQSYNQAVESNFLFVLKLVLVSAVILAFTWALAYNRGFPYVLITVAVLILIYNVVTNRTVFGRHVYSVGGNLSAARLSGVSVRSVNFWVMVNMGFLTGIAAAVFSSRSNGAQPGMGNMFELDVIAACFIGGASTMGGVGRVGGALVGGLVMAVMTNGMQLMGVPQSLQLVIKGLVLLLAVAFDIYNKRRAGATR